MTQQTDELTTDPRTNPPWIITIHPQDETTVIVAITNMVTGTEKHFPATTQEMMQGVTLEWLVKQFVPSAF